VISSHHKVEIFQVLSFRTTYFKDPWILPSPSAMMDGIGNPYMSMPFSASEVAYSLVQQASAKPDLTLAQELDPLLEPIWAQGSLPDTDSLDLVFPFDEVGIEEMTSPDKPWEYLHHRSYFLLELSRIEVMQSRLQARLLTGSSLSSARRTLTGHSISLSGNLHQYNSLHDPPLFTYWGIRLRDFVRSVVERCTLESPRPDTSQC
jgi:hypothetical protein